MPNHFNHKSLKEYCEETGRLQILEEWDYKENLPDTPETIAWSSTKIMHWKCEKGHTWAEPVRNRTKRYGYDCPVCANRLLLPGVNDLRSLYPDLAKEWHPTKNGDLKPEEILPTSFSKVWWICEKGHEWEARVDARTLLGTGCPVCAGRKVISGDNDLASCYPKIAAEWHPTRNGDMQPNEIYKNSTQKVWWLCSRDGTEWEAKISDRVKGKAGCPTCLQKNGGQYDQGQSLLDYCVENHLENLVYEWDDNANAPSTPAQIPAQSNKVITWKCPKGHSWRATIKDRLSGKAYCPYCASRYYLPRDPADSLAALAPDLAKEWHPTKNAPLTPETIPADSYEKVWWQCKYGHEWQGTVNHRYYNNSSCPFCSSKKFQPGVNDLETLYPEIAKEWHPTLNGVLTPDRVLAGSSNKYWWLCPNGHVYNASPISRTRHHCGCPYCSNKKVWKGFNDLASQYPEIAAEWYPSKNGDFTPDQISIVSTKSFWWICPEGHEWKGAVRDRTRQNKSCPVCKRNHREQVAKEKELERQRKREEARKLGPKKRKNTHPKSFESVRVYCMRMGLEYVLEEWDDEKNLPMTPDNTPRASTNEVHWKCEKGHEWVASPYYRLYNNYNCPYCAGRLAIPGKTDLSTLYPEVAALWHPTKNGDLRPDKVKPGSTYNVWWRCEHGHEWKQTIQSLVQAKTKCPYCSGRYVVEGMNDLASQYPEIAAMWHPVKNGKKTPKDFAWNAERYAWWIDHEGEPFKERISVMTKGEQEWQPLKPKL